MRRKAGLEWLSLVKRAEPVGREGGLVREQGGQREGRKAGGKEAGKEGGGKERERERLVYSEAV